MLWTNNTISKLIFEDVYWAKMIFNSGVIAEDECISTVYISKKDDFDLLKLYKDWNGLLDEISLNCFVIITATYSEIKIMANRFNMGG